MEWFKAKEKKDNSVWVLEYEIISYNMIRIHTYYSLLPMQFESTKSYPNFRFIRGDKGIIVGVHIRSHEFFVSNPQ